MANFKQSAGPDEYKDKFIANLNLYNNQLISNIAFETINLANQLQHIRVSLQVKSHSKKTDKQQNQLGPELSLQYGLLLSLTEAQVQKHKLPQRELEVIEESKKLLYKPYGSYDTIRLVECAKSYFNILVRTGIFNITHSYEDETLETKLNKW